MQKTDLFVHVGLHKTGTTYLQQAIFPNLQGIRYLGKPYIDSFLERFLHSEDTRALLSNEQFSSPPIGRLLVEENARRLSDVRRHCLTRLHIIYPNAGVLMGVRRQSGYVRSLYSQYVRFGGTVGLDEFWHPTHGVVTGPDLELLPVVSLLSRLWAQTFLFSLEQLSEAPLAVLLNMANFLGAELPSHIAKNSVNTSITRELADEILVFSRGEGLKLSAADKRRKISQIEKAHEGQSGTELALNPRLRSEIDDFYASDWEAVKKHLITL